MMHLFILIKCLNQTCRDQVLPANEHPRGRGEQAHRCQAPRLRCSSVHRLHPLQGQPAGCVKELLNSSTFTITMFLYIQFLTCTLLNETSQVIVSCRTYHRLYRQYARRGTASTPMNSPTLAHGYVIEVVAYGAVHSL